MTWMHLKYSSVVVDSAFQIIDGNLILDSFIYPGLVDKWFQSELHVISAGNLSLT